MTFQSHKFVSFSHGLSAPPSNPVGFVSRWLSARRMVQAIAELDDHLLADIGLTRDDVRWAQDHRFSLNAAHELERRSGRA